MNPTRDIKVMVVGSTSVGKTCLLISYTTNSFPGEYVPTVFDNYSANALVDNHPVALGLWDTAGSKEYDEFRPLSYPGTDVFIVCYAINSRESLDDVRDKWVPEIRDYSQETPFVIIGTKSDYRDSGGDLISIQEGKDLANSLGAYAYIECSALTQANLNEVFDETVRCVINPGSASGGSSEPVEESTSSKGKKKKDKKKGGLFSRKKKK
eukprot:TRINITY_DN3581_c0_g1_i1.p1 TRINITY_DN3581_c0_g1~~TRINITY_DN3581_c0_g1_i1.p1  ORF type:complete len:210 (+),score=45.80 TRINITY_DN3581_c0_g1_i1:26-655(+)